MVAMLRKNQLVSLLIAAIVVAVLMGIAALTGRRTSLIEVAVFASVYVIPLGFLEKRVGRMGDSLGSGRTGGISMGWSPNSEAVMLLSHSTEDH